MQWAVITKLSKLSEVNCKHSEAFVQTMPVCQMFVVQSVRSKKSGREVSPGRCEVQNYCTAPFYCTLKNFLDAVGVTR